MHIRLMQSLFLYNEIFILLMNKNLTVISSVSIVVIVFSIFSIGILYKIQHRPINLNKNKISLMDSTIKVAVLNGCGRPGLASIFVEKLRNKGFDVINGLGDNADSFDFDISVVIDRKGSRENAEFTARALGIKEILDQRSDNPYIIEDVVIILGRDWDTLNGERKDLTY